MPAFNTIGDFGYVEEVFTPNIPALKSFVERDSVNHKVASALRIPGRQLIVYGINGVGKTTLIERNLERYRENFFFTNCTSDMNEHSLIIDGFDKLRPYYISERREVQSRGIKLRLEGEYWKVKSILESHQNSEVELDTRPIIPPQLTTHNLVRFFGEANCCWVLDDFHKIRIENRQAIVDIIKMFVDNARFYPDLTIIAIGAVSTAEDIIPSSVELRGRLTEVKVPLMSDEEIAQIIKKGEDILNISFDPVVKKSVIHISSGLPMVCHELCLQLCYAADIRWTTDALIRIDKEHLKDALYMFVDSMIEDIKSSYDAALRNHRSKRYNHEVLIIEALACLNRDGVYKRELLKEIRKVEPQYRKQYLTSHLSKLTEMQKGCFVSYDSRHDKYNFEHPTKRALAVAMYYAREFSQ